jgi:hypothetical protein
MWNTRYFEANYWGGLASAVRRSTDGSPMDCIVQLYHENRIHGPIPQGVRRILFKTLDQIPSLLGFTGQSISALELDQRTGTAPPVPSHALMSRVDELPQDATLLGMQRGVTSGAATHTTNHMSDQFTGQDTRNMIAVAEETVQAEDAAEELELDPTVDAETLAQSMNTTRVQHVVDAPSQEQIEAACVIQTMYRRNLLRRHRGTRTKLSEARRRFFIECWAESEKMTWPHRYYRLLFLGPLPHLLLCLERANTVAFESKVKAKRDLFSATNLQIEHAQKTMNLARWVYLGDEWQSWC